MARKFFSFDHWYIFQCISEYEIQTRYFISTGYICGWLFATIHWAPLHICYIILWKFYGTTIRFRCAIYFTASEKWHSMWSSLPSGSQQTLVEINVIDGPFAIRHFPSGKIEIITFERHIRVLKLTLLNYIRSLYASPQTILWCHC